MIDLHSHTNQSDGSLSPEELIAEAVRSGVHVLGITDHDSFAGFDRVSGSAPPGLELVCGIELSTKLNGRSVHLLGYFAPGEVGDSFREWVLDFQASRRERNIRLAARLRELGFDITVEEAEALGRGVTGRPHFARLLVDKGYVSSIRRAFDEYLDESAVAYVYRREPELLDAVGLVRAAGGVACLAHPARVNADVPSLLPVFCAHGLNAIEAYHSDHTPAETESYLSMARKYGLLVTGGSDFHGAVKPAVRLGTGFEGNLHVPPEVMDGLRAAWAASAVTTVTEKSNSV